MIESDEIDLRTWLKDEFGKIGARFDGVDGRLDTMGGRLDTMDGRFDTMGGRLDTMDGRLGTIERHLDKQDADLEKRTLSILQTIEARYQDARLWSSKLFALVDQDLKLHREEHGRRKRPRPPASPAKRK